jgi:Tol biopolymer transport system component
MIRLTKRTIRVQTIGWRRLCSLVVCVLPMSVVCDIGWGQQPTELLIAYGSYKDRGKYPTITFYEHDAIGNGKVIGTIPAVNLRSDSHPTLSHDGRWCAFTSELENQTSRILLWDMQARQLVEQPVLNDSPNSQQHAAISGDGRLIAFAAWNRPGSSNRWDVLCFHIAAKKLDSPALWNTPADDERMPSLSADGRLLAITTNAVQSESQSYDTSRAGVPNLRGIGQTDITLWDRAEGKSLPLPGLNSANRDVEPHLSADGRWIAFVSDRPGGVGGRDVYLYGRQAQQLVPLPGLNSIAHEQMPSLSPDGRFLVFVSERISGAGERDVFLYDRPTQKLLSTPELNSKREEIDPCVIVLP